MSGALGGAPCAFIVPGVDLANHSFRPNATFGVAEDCESFQLTWDMEHSTAPGKSREPVPPRANDEVLICYGARMPNALLMLHYGFLDPENPNDQLPMECMIPGARRIRSSAVAAAGKALSDEGDERAEWAARCMLAMADPTGAGDDGSDAACVAEMDAAARRPSWRVSRPRRRRTRSRSATRGARRTHGDVRAVQDVAETERDGVQEVPRGGDARGEQGVRRRGTMGSRVSVGVG